MTLWSRAFFLGIEWLANHITRCANLRIFWFFFHLFFEGCTRFNRDLFRSGCFWLIIFNYFWSFRRNRSLCCFFGRSRLFGRRWLFLWRSVICCKHAFLYNLCLTRHKIWSWCRCWYRSCHWFRCRSRCRRWRWRWIWRTAIQKCVVIDW